MGERVYLDWNATSPLRPEARAAMISALDVVGNPSSVHKEGRAARSVIESARAGIASELGVDAGNVVFTSGATEAAALALAGRNLRSAPVEHEAVLAWTTPELVLDPHGRVKVDEPEESSLQLANSETGILQDLPEGIDVTDATQAVGKIPVSRQLKKARAAIISAHKFGGPKGIGALVLAEGREVLARQRGGGQELGRRSGTENVVAIAGFDAALRAAARDVWQGDWEEVAEYRDALEARLLDAEQGVIIVGKEADRLPNTSCFAVPGWKSEMQVIQMDLDGFAISAGSACSSGKVRERNALRGLVSDAVGATAIRVSIGPGTKRSDVMRFADAWIRCRRELGMRRRSRDFEGLGVQAA